MEYFYRFITRQENTPGPFGLSTTLDQLEPGDFVQLRFNKEVFGHTPIVVQMGYPPTLENTLIAAHSIDADFRPLSTYFFQEIRFLHILGAYPQRPAKPGRPPAPPEGEPAPPPPNPNFNAPRPPVLV